MIDKIRVLGLDIEIITDNRDGVGANNVGSYNAKLGKVWIDGTQPKKEQRITLLHEIVELIDYHCNLNLNHTQVSTLSAVMHEVIQNNMLYGE